MSLNNVYCSGIERVWNEDAENQEKFLTVVGNLRGMDASIFYDVGAFFVPNNEYMIHYFGTEILKEEMGCYSYSGQCNWQNCVVIPITNVVGNVVGLGSFNPFLYAEAHETKDWSLHYYAYSPKSVFPKGKYLYFPKNGFDKAVKDGYMFLVDGFFDAISVYAAGFNAGATMGSIITPEMLVQLRFIDRIIHIADNDAAGYEVYEQLRKHLKNVELLKQGKTKDADELLKSENREQFIHYLQDTVINGRKAVRLVSF